MKEFDRSIQLETFKAALDNGKLLDMVIVQVAATEMFTHRIARATGVSPCEITRLRGCAL